MRLLHLSTFLQGGAGRAITDLALAQHAAGHIVSVAIEDQEEPGYQSYPEYLERLETAGIPVHRVHSTFKRDLSRNLAAVEQLRTLPEMASLHLVHAHAAVPSLVARLMTARSQRPVAVVHTMHGWGTRKTSEQAASDVVALNLANRVVVPSATSAALLDAFGVDRDLVRVVPYGVRDERHRPVPDEALLADLRRRWSLMVGCVGTIGERKNQRLVIDALAQVRGAVVGCVFIGDGDVAGLSSYARMRGVADRAVVLGYRKDASQYLRRMDACVLASTSEGQPLTVLEAFRDRVPVLAADIEELREIIDHRVTGWLFANGDARSLASMLEKAARGAVRGVADAARERYETRYTVDQMVDGYATVYGQAVA
jgi:L-malate glycosyltransferase